MVLVSSCLWGEKCKYNGGDNLNEQVIQYCKGKEVICACPEVLGGLSTPRTPAEIVGGTAQDVLKGKAQVMTKDGDDVTSAFIKGAYLTLELVKEKGIELAILKAKSPSCGRGQIYDGKFQKKLILGNGVTAELLMQEGIEVLTELEID